MKHTIRGWQTRELRIEEHPEYGGLGLSPLWLPNHEGNDPLGGMGVAHDILEHGRDDTCEWQGLGGAVLVRASQGYFGRRGGNPHPHENIGSDFVQLFHLWNGEDIPDPGRTYPVDDDTIIVESVDYGCSLTRSELITYGHATPDEAQQIKHWTRQEQRRRMIGWMRRGYRAASKRFKSFSMWEVSQMFSVIESAVDRYLASDGKEYEGLTVDLRFNIEAQRCNIGLQEDPYTYDDEEG